MTTSTGRSGYRLGFAVAVPIAIAAVAYGLFLLTDRLVSVLPLDRAAFGWAAVIPLWLAGPPAAALAWRHLNDRDRLLAAAAVLALIGGVAASLFWRSQALAACSTGAVVEPADWVIHSIILGAVVGAGPAVGGLAGSYVEPARPWNVALRGAAAGVALNVLAFAMLVTFLAIPTCERERPQVGAVHHIAREAASLSAEA